MKVIVFSLFFFLSLMLISCTSQEMYSNQSSSQEQLMSLDNRSYETSNTEVLKWEEVIPLRLPAFEKRKEVDTLGYIRPYFDGDDSIKIKNFYLIDDFGDKILLGGISRGFKSSYILLPATQIYRVEGVFELYPSKKIQVSNISPGNHTVIQKNLSYNQTSCNGTKPVGCKDEYVCASGEFILAPGYCGCSENETYFGGSCKKKNVIFPVEQPYEAKYSLIDLDFNFSGNAYDRDYFRELESNAITKAEYYKEKIENKYQKELLEPLVDQFRPSERTDVFLVTSFVQKIDYDVPGYLYDGVVNKYPYEVLYDNLGVCGDKSFLLIFLLSELGYETAYIIFEEDNHAAVGIACDTEHSFFETGWCYIETTFPTFITDYGNDFLSKPQNFEIYPMSEGKSFDATRVVEDFKEYKSLIRSGRKKSDGSIELDEIDYVLARSLLQNYGLW